MSPGKTGYDLDKDRLRKIVRAVLREDIGEADITTTLLIPDYASIRACIIAREDAVFCGGDLIEMTLGLLDGSIRFKPQIADGEQVKPGREIALIEGPARPILTAERTLLNFISHLSGISTMTRRFVEAADNPGLKIMDTRKTTPLLRYLEKYAVRVGGGFNHRFGLWDQVMIKDNHKAILKSKKKSLSAAVEYLKKNISSQTLIEIEADTFEEFRQALTFNPHIILLDNMDPETVKKCVDHKNTREAYQSIELEVSGSVNIDSIGSYAKTGVDRISVGALTHSIKSIDFSLEIIA